MNTIKAVIKLKYPFFLIVNSKNLRGKGMEKPTHRVVRHGIELFHTLNPFRFWIFNIDSGYLRLIMGKRLSI